MKTNTKNAKSSLFIASKTISILVVIVATFFTQATYAQDGPKTQPADLFHTYLDIKNALVAGDAPATSLSAAQYVKTLMGIDPKLIPEGTRNALLKHAGLMSISKDLKHQREDFQPLSANMYLVAKSMKLSSDPIYYTYCPMKKAYWLSNEAAIKNPYYGNAMLTCGQVRETIK